MTKRTRDLQDETEPGAEGVGAPEDVASATAAEDADPPMDEGAASASPEEGDESAEELDLTRELDRLNDRHLRLAAEFQNYRRRAELEMTGAWSRAQGDLVRRFVDVLDDLQRVAGLDPSDERVSVQSIVEGIDLVERKFMRALEDAGVEVVDPAGAPFDPNTMEAVMRAPAETEEEDDHVQDVFQRGYVLKGHLIRPARVSVKKHE